jgi:hypothetical protein
MTVTAPVRMIQRAESLVVVVVNVGTVACLSQRPSHRAAAGAAAGARDAPRWPSWIDAERSPRMRQR